MPDPAPKVSATAQTRNINELDETRWERIAANFRTIVGALLLAFVLRTCLFEAFEIEGPSMEPTLLNGDRVVVSKFAYGLFLPLRDHAEITWGKPNAGDVVILKSPADGVDIIKRVIGVGGDFIEVRADRVYRNGQALPASDVGECSAGSTGALESDCRVYESKIDDRVFHISTAHISRDPLPVRVPEGSVYVLGDHRDHSNDSRNEMVGAVPINRIKGRALSIYWSSGPEGFRWKRIFSAIH
jgi:signal peptidase I